MQSGITVEKISPILGAKIHGLDLAKPMDDETFAFVHDTWIKHQVLAFPRQELTHEEYAAFAGRFGELYGVPFKRPGRTGDSIVTELRADEKSTHAFGESWHVDMSSEEVPPMGTMLRLVQIPPDGGGDTLFACMYRAYEMLSDRVKTLLDGLTATHDSSVFAKKYGVQEGLPSAVHPVIRTHPVSKRKLLFVNTRFTKRINELSEIESRAILDMLFKHIAETVVLQLRFRWEKDTLILWDNRCVQHCAIFDYWPHVRTGFRVMIRGDRPV